jgi:hypothetical protein
MSAPRKPPVPNVEVADPAAAFRNLQRFGERIMAVPKKEIGSTPKRVKRKPKRA